MRNSGSDILHRFFPGLLKVFCFFSIFLLSVSYVEDQDPRFEPLWHTAAFLGNVRRWMVDQINIYRIFYRSLGQVD